MQPDVGDRLAEGGRALDASAWEEARDALEPPVAGEELPEALDGYGIALWCLGDLQEAWRGGSARSRPS